MRGETRGEQIRQKETAKMRKDTRQNEEKREYETLR